MRAALSWGLIWMVRVYQACLSPYLGRHCKHYPTCSHYFIQAVQKHGPFRGTWKGLCRIARCHPFSRGGYDPVD
jgi:putative membrane protein insertion efficiency factor